MTRSQLPFDSVVATGRGDDGTTGLLFGGERVRKDDLRTEAYGTVDEAVAALGLARAELGMKQQYGVLSHNFGGLGDTILRLQRELSSWARSSPPTRMLGASSRTASPA